MTLFVFPPAPPEPIRALGAADPWYPRTEHFGNVMTQVEAGLLALTGCPAGGRVISLTASGTGAMEAAVAGLLTDTTRALVLAGGTFGFRWAELCRFHGVPTEVLALPAGRDPDMGRVRARINHATGLDAVLMQHHETSSGQLYNIARVAETCRATGALFIVDAIGSFLADPLHMEDMGIDVAVLSSHKGLCLPPGLSFLVLGPRALERPFRRRSYYFDLARNLADLARGQAPYTPAVTLLRQLHARLDMLLPDGGAAERRAVVAKATAFRDAVGTRGLTGETQTPSAMLTMLAVPRAHALCGELAQEGVYVLPCRDDGHIRVAHPGRTTVADHCTLANRLAAWQNSGLRQEQSGNDR